MAVSLRLRWTRTPYRSVHVRMAMATGEIVVYDSNTGAFKRGWGAYGIPLSEIDNGKLPAYDPSAPPSKQFLGPVHSVRISREGLVYVCDRTADRIQVFTKQGKIREGIFAGTPKTLGAGSTWSVNFSHDPKQQYLLVGDGRNNMIWILNRDNGAVVGSFGHNGRNAGQFHWVHQVVVDSRGNLYTGEVDTGKRVQKFVLQNRTTPGRGARSIHFLESIYFLRSDTRLAEAISSIGDGEGAVLFRGHLDPISCPVVLGRRRSWTWRRGFGAAR